MCPNFGNLTEGKNIWHASHSNICKNKNKKNGGENKSAKKSMELGTKSPTKRTAPMLVIERNNYTSIQHRVNFGSERAR